MSSKSEIRARLTFAVRPPWRLWLAACAAQRGNFRRDQQALSTSQLSYIANVRKTRNRAGRTGFIWFQSAPTAARS